MSRITTIALAAALSIAACADQPTAPAVPTSRAVADLASTSSIWASQVTGETGPNSQYALYLPVGWTGDVVYYAHGIRPPSDPVNLPVNLGIPALRDALGAKGVAFAYSSFDENGYAVKDGAQRTHQLRGLFTSKFGPARRSYLVGHSMGALIVQNLAEEFPSQYDGTLAMCGLLGGGRSEVDYLANVRVLFDWFYKKPTDPQIIPGDFYTPPPAADINPILAGVQNAVIADGFAKLYTMKRFKQTPLEGNTPVEVLTSLLTAIGNGLGLTENVLSQTHGHPFFDNVETDYQAQLTTPLPAWVLTAVNDRTTGVERYAGTPDAMSFIDRYYTPSGALGMPTITLHTTRDPFVPSVKHETEFANAVNARGASSLLVQRTVDRFGHCNFQTSEVVDAFDALSAWVESGSRPTS